MPERPLVVIGWVRNDVPFGSQDVPWRETRSTIEVEPAFAPGLEGIEGFSHVYVVFRFEGEEVHLRSHPRRRQDLPEIGVFASRSPHRPSPLGLTLVELLERQGNRLLVLGLDAWDGTPVLDLKPFMLPTLPDGLRFPAWVERLEWKGE
jgi:tRNA-Thr(GGU) m(6)t(6)A37 methyltransferase TsaA